MPEAVVERFRPYLFETIDSEYENWEIKDGVWQKVIKVWHAYHMIAESKQTNYVNYGRHVKQYASCLAVVPLLMALAVAATGNGGNSATARNGRRKKKTPEAIDIDAFVALLSK